MHLVPVPGRAQQAQQTEQTQQMRWTRETRETHWTRWTSWTLLLSPANFQLFVSVAFSLALLIPIGTELRRIQHVAHAVEKLAHAAGVIRHEHDIRGAIASDIDHRVQVLRDQHEHLW